MAIDYLVTWKNSILKKDFFGWLHRLTALCLQVSPMPQPYLRVGQVAWAPQKRTAWHSKLRQLSQTFQSPVLISTSEQDGYDPHPQPAAGAWQLLGEGWIPQWLSQPSPPRTREIGPHIPNLGFLPRFLEKNQVTDTLDWHIRSPLTKESWFLPNSGFRGMLVHERGLSTQPTRPAPWPGHCWVTDMKGWCNLCASLIT